MAHSHNVIFSDCECVLFSTTDGLHEFRFHFHNCTKLKISFYPMQSIYCDIKSQSQSLLVNGPQGLQCICRQSVGNQFLSHTAMHYNDFIGSLASTILLYTLLGLEGCTRFTPLEAVHPSPMFRVHSPGCIPCTPFQISVQWHNTQK